MIIFNNITVYIILNYTIYIIYIVCTKFIIFYKENKRYYHLSTFNSHFQKGIIMPCMSPLTSYDKMCVGACVAKDNSTSSMTCTSCL